MPKCKLIIEVQDAGGTPESLKWAWVYWRVGQVITVLRTDDEGRLFVLNDLGDRTKPWDYDRIRFTTDIGATADIYFSRGAKPIPEPRLNDHAGVFYPRTVKLPPNGTSLPGSEAQVAPISTNVLAQLPTALIILPNHVIELSVPAELRFWPLLWELPTDAYHTDGFPQGNALWGGRAGATLTVTEDRNPANAPAVAVRPRERGLWLKGKIDDRATGVR